MNQTNGVNVQKKGRDLFTVIQDGVFMAFAAIKVNK